MLSGVELVLVDITVRHIILFQLEVLVEATAHVSGIILHDSTALVSLRSRIMWRTASIIRLHIWRILELRQMTWFLDCFELLRWCWSI